MADEKTLKLGGNMISIPIDAQAYSDLNDALRDAEVRIPAYAISVTFVLWADEFEDETAAKEHLHEVTEWLHDEVGIASIYYGDEVKSCEIDEERDVYEDSFDGFPKV